MGGPVDLGEYARNRTALHGPKPGLRVLIAAVEQLRQLHAPAVVCRGCCRLTCRGDCDWADAYGRELLTVCGHCCIDSEEGRQSYPCLDHHSHGAEHGPQQAICATGEILATITQAERQK